MSVNHRCIGLAVWLSVSLLGCGGGDGPAVTPSAQGQAVTPNPPEMPETPPAASGSAPAENIARYDVMTTFYEPDTQPRDTIFIGTFTYNATTGEVSDLQGTLTESMTGNPSGAAPHYDMTRLPLAHQLSSVHDAALGGRLVTTFRLNSTATLSTMSEGDGWSPGTGFGLYNGFPGANPGNAYVRIFVNESDPTLPLTPAQIDKLAYADCAPGGMMSATCMTGTTVAGYGSVGTMSGYPVTQVIRKRP
jgi:hypothetical protein